MNTYKEQVISNTKLNDDEVRQYLLKNPDFFMRNADLVKQMRLPQAMQGSISLVEWQLHRQRRQINQLQEEITLLMEYAGLNEMLCKRFFQLQANLALASTLPEMLKRLQCWAKTFGLLGTQVRLFSDRWQIEQFPGLPHSHLAMLRSDFEPLRRQYLAEKQHFLGSLSENELRLLLPKFDRVGSVALSLLGKKGDLGVIIFSSSDGLHYQQGMGTMILHQVATFLPGLLARWIKRK